MTIHNGECREYPVRIEKYMPLQNRYCCILVGCIPERGYQKTEEGQRVYIHERVMNEFEILNPEMLMESTDGE